jgi:hypothetical protein
MRWITNGLANLNFLVPQKELRARNQHNSQKKPGKDSLESRLSQFQINAKLE